MSSETDVITEDYLQASYILAPSVVIGRDTGPMYSPDRVSIKNVAKRLSTVSEAFSDKMAFCLALEIAANCV